MSDPLNILFSTFSFIGFVAVLIPSYWHLKAANVATCLYIFWAALGCLNMFINARIWDGNIRNTAPIWCDISTRVIIAENVAMPASILCITRQLYKVTGLAKGDLINKRREGFIDLAIGLGLPILQMPLSYIVQGHRFDIIEDIGCWPATYDTAAACALVLGWPLALGLVSASFGLCALHRFIMHSRELRSLMSSDKTHRSQTFRLIVLATSDITITIPLSVFFIYFDGLHAEPWISWQYVHSDFSAIGFFPAAQWKSDKMTQIAFQSTQWSTVLCALIFFILFGTFSEEASEHYRLAYRFARSRFGCLLPCLLIRRPAKHSTPAIPITANINTPQSQLRVSFIGAAHGEMLGSLDVLEKATGS
ncbi:STE3-domain-containing protein [Artomyces pyxidatus]|uniref:STE3-domain-containing protein n=1 Tax=Artomyces pyxidatus TaxID=48021 RepID=A0ACB8SZY6_9AGAM|nr:STE3-domain-containing protein [Artomyces pyxidatus]